MTCHRLKNIKAQEIYRHNIQKPIEQKCSRVENYWTSNWQLVNKLSDHGNWIDRYNVKWLISF